MEDFPPQKKGPTEGELKKIKKKQLAEKKDKKVEKFDKRDNVARIINEYAKDNFDMENYTEMHETLGNLLNTSAQIKTARLNAVVRNTSRMFRKVKKGHFM